MTSDQPVPEMRGINKAYGAVQALGDVRLDLGGGEAHALLGENGAPGCRAACGARSRILDPS